MRFLDVRAVFRVAYIVRKQGQLLFLGTLLQLYVTTSICQIERNIDVKLRYCETDYMKHVYEIRNLMVTARNYAYGHHLKIFDSPMS